MKKMMVIDIWGILLGFSLMLNNYVLFGIVLEILVLLYNIKFVRNINYWRFSIITIFFSIFNYYLVLNSSISKIKLITPFLLLICVNTSIVNEIAYKIKAKYIIPIYTVISLAFITFLIIAIIIPYSPLLPDYKNNLFIYISLIFIPSFISLSICLLFKMINKKKINSLYVLK